MRYRARRPDGRTEGQSPHPIEPWDMEFESKANEEKTMAQAAQASTQVSNRKAMMVVLNLPCFSRNRCSEGKKGKKAYSRREKHQGRRDW